MFRNGQREYHIEAKNYYDKTRRFDDFSLGFFSEECASPIASVELKTADTRLDAPQTSGAYQGKTPVQQAFDAATGSPEIKWIVVSNFDEMRLYPIDSPEQHECIQLSEILSINDFSRAYALLGRPTLLGRRGGASPLDQLLHGHTPMFIDKHPRRVRLVQEAKLNLDQDFGFHELDDSLRSALRNIGRNWPGIDHVDSCTTLEDDRIVLKSKNQGEDYGACRIEIVRNGTIRISEHIPPDHKNTLPQLSDQNDHPITQLDDELLILSATKFVKFVNLLYLKLVEPTSINISVSFHCELLDTSGAQYLTKAERTAAWLPHNCPQSIDRVFTTRSGIPFSREADDIQPGIPPQDRLSMISYIVRELLFPFEHQHHDELGRPGKRSRHQHTYAEILNLLARHNFNH